LNDPLKRVIGAAGVNSLVPAPSIGYTLHPDFWRNGYATEAVTAIVDQWCKLPRRNPEGLELALPKERLFAACNKENVGSIKVLQRSGFVMYDELVLEDDVAALFESEIPFS
jgi:RimJ/RimL family protein N-acetyltransferase